MTFRMPNMITSLKKPVQEKYVENPIDMRELYEKDKAIIENKKMRSEHIAAMEQWEKERDRDDDSRNMFKHQYMNNIKLGVLESTGKQIADRVLSETFANIYLKSLPLDAEFITENSKHLKDFAYMYIRKLGGMNYLKKRVMEAHSPFLNKLYNICMEQANKMTKKRGKKIMIQNSTDLLHEITDKKCTDEENNQILKNIDQLGADELAELVKQKIVNVVKDEKTKEVEEREFRTVLKNDLLDTSTPHPVDNEVADPKTKTDDAGLPDTGDKVEELSKDDLSSTPDAGKPDKTIKNKPAGSGFDPEKIQKKDKQDTVNKKEDKVSKKAKNIDQDAEINKMENETKDKKKEKTESKMTKESYGSNLTLKETMESYNPVDGQTTYNRYAHPRGLFFSIFESVLATMYPRKEFKTENFINKKKYTAVLENPLNLDVFSTYLQNGDDSINTLEQAPISDPNVIGDTSHIDSASILTESVIQYGLLETAYTMKLIQVTPAMVIEQCKYLKGLL